jgi:hypothetical protein
MKHLLNNFDLRRASMSRVLAVPKNKYRSWLYQMSLLTGLFLLFTAQQLQGQCTSLVCNGTQANPLELAVNNSCQAVILADEVIDMTLSSCTGLKQVTVRDDMSNVIADAQTVATFDASPYINQILSVTITDVSTNIFCVGFVRLLDNMPPSIDCMALFRSCAVDTSAAAIGFPTITDACDSNPTITYTDLIDDLDCQNMNIAVINRMWEVRDASGNLSMCSQPIVLSRPDLANIAFPPNIDLTCDAPDAGTDITGRPRLDGEEIESGGFCDLLVTFSDDTTFTCSTVEYTILRSWTITEDCDGQTTTNTQTIRIMDETPPTITCPADIMVQTSPGNCFASVILDSPTVTDNCDSGASFFVNTSYGAVGLGPHPVVPVGTHTIQYTALDQCGNTSICTSSLTVVDEEEPTAVCEDQTIVSLPSTGLGEVDAFTFDDGSSDNCATHLFYKARRMDIGGCNFGNGDDSDTTPGFQEWFDDKVLFCCDETEDTVMVIMRVYEIDPGDGPIDPIREIVGGDLFGRFTECMVAVTIQDKLFPVFTHCPNDIVIDCQDDYSDLSIFGTPEVVDNCGFTIDSTSTESIDDCGVGVLTRTWTATDFSGQQAVCTQTITVVNNNPFTEDQIVWPDDYTTTICGANVDPNDLPDGFDEPEILGDACGIISYNYEDHLFDISFPACYKILRTWTVLDWCQYEPQFPDNGGRWTHTQIIKVEDDTDPVVTCPASLTVPVSANCETASVTLDPVVADDCSPSLLINNNSPYANSGGANASGTYPLGETVVRFSVSDRCGNTETCETTIMVTDQTAPASICIVGLSINLTPMNGELMAMVDATAFDGGSFDNCTPDEDILRTIRVTPDPSAPSNIPASSTQLSFTCEDVGTQFVELWLTDDKGNSDYCVTYVLIQDNLGTCPTQMATGSVAGSIITEDGENVEEVMVYLNGDTSQMLTGLDGAFEFFDIPFGMNFSVVPEKDDNILNGVNTLDLILIRKHILGVEPFDSPYKMIAADVDRSGFISIGDLIALRKIILSIDDTFPNDNTSWRFIDADYAFPDPDDPFKEDFPEALSVNNFNLDDLFIDFVGIKVGDVDYTAIPNMLAEVVDRDPDSELNLMMEDIAIDAGDTEIIHITAANLSEFLGFQFTIQFDLDRIELIDLFPGDIPEMSLDNFNFENFADGFFTASWGTFDPVIDMDDAILFSLEVRARQFAKTKEVFYVSSSRTQSEAYTLSSQPADVVLDFVFRPESLNVDGLNLYQNYPNPFREVTSILFEIPEEEFVTLSVMNAAGQLVYYMEGDYARGKHMVSIREEDLPANGVYYYRMTTSRDEVTRKMLLMK